MILDLLIFLFYFRYKIAQRFWLVHNSFVLMIAMLKKMFIITDVEEFELPPSRYGGELAESCDKLEASLKRLQDIKPN